MEEYEPILSMGGVLMLIPAIIFLLKEQYMYSIIFFSLIIPCIFIHYIINDGIRICNKFLGKVKGD